MREHDLVSDLVWPQFIRSENDQLPDAIQSGALSVTPELESFQML